MVNFNGPGGILRKDLMIRLFAKSSNTFIIDLISSTFSYPHPPAPRMFKPLLPRMYAVDNAMPMVLKITAGSDAAAAAAEAAGAPRDLICTKENYFDKVGIESLAACMKGRF